MATSQKEKRVTSSKENKAVRPGGLKVAMRITTRDPEPECWYDVTEGRRAVPETSNYQKKSGALW